MHFIHPEKFLEPEKHLEYIFCKTETADAPIPFFEGNFGTID